jgi:dihydrofolate reductase
MRKLIYQAMISLDGFYEGPQGELDRHVVDEEFNDYAAGLLNQTDILVFGRKTYEMMAAYWSTDAAIESDPVVAERMNAIEKIVVSQSLDTCCWNNSRLITGDIYQEIEQLKKKDGRQLAIFGSSQLAGSLMEHALIDEYRIIVNPIFLGGGKQLFNSNKARLKMHLKDSYVFNSGNVLHYYVQK